MMKINLNAHQLLKAIHALIGDAHDEGLNLKDLEFLGFVTGNDALRGAAIEEFERQSWISMPTCYRRMRSLQAAGWADVAKIGTPPKKCLRLTERAQAYLSQGSAGVLRRDLLRGWHGLFTRGRAYPALNPNEVALLAWLVSHQTQGALPVRPMSDILRVDDAMDASVAVATRYRVVHSLLQKRRLEVAKQGEGKRAAALLRVPRHVVEYLEKFVIEVSTA